MTRADSEVVKDMSGQELLEDLLAKAMVTTGEGRLLALVAIPRESGSRGA